jgi:DNA-binding protein HU-beta
MKKDEMIARVAAGTGMTKRQAAKALEAMLMSITGQLKKGKKVSLSGFGTFTVSKRKARPGRNPRTGAIITIPATKVPVFRAGTRLKSAVRQ